ncbi:H-2 class II histocompatibility antigen gamma chain-like isoform X2 [Gouania willdenowi]|uniref:H-2 class II histocompatibility antigen gamma chain-like isoform X2 n=1 Tax=Gouania willdenowi TaxID=441366 RepID=UPI001056591C|nr:HLA class II histocompatibility antigen gamma chain isoform X2 [Gouania willdenowi]
MADPSEKNPLVKDRESQHISAAQKGCSTGCTLMIAGLASLLCLMVCSQIFSIYMIFKQMERIERLQESKEEINGRLNQLSQADTRLSLWIVENSLNQHEDATSKSQLNDTDVEKVLMELLQDLELPQFNETFSGNLLSLNQQMNESMWKSFETWMQNWLIFQKAQQMVSVTKTKCQIEAQTAVGPYKPQCRSWGEYMQKQCYGSTGYCWCVDVVSGKRIKDTLKHGDPECWRVTRATHKNHVMDEDYGELMIN